MHGFELRIENAIYIPPPQPTQQAIALAERLTDLLNRPQFNDYETEVSVDKAGERSETVCVSWKRVVKLEVANDVDGLYTNILQPLYFETRISPLNGRLSIDDYFLRLRNVKNNLDHIHKQHTAYTCNFQ
jgi:hypothetical protein